MRHDRAVRRSSSFRRTTVERDAGERRASIDESTLSQVSNMFFYLANNVVGVEVALSELVSLDDALACPSPKQVLSSTIELGLQRCLQHIK